ncbi:hypothetical protein FRX31_008934 [Thalictrum thalictroides]|uniref:Uncharacterized protein n=1 Tax=Thalictrum thalictroides TaxID=46969 RepID=A0A7J6WY26_THATH|nr:hypothetical protein FRX31_008934 [Thalictrum thalictroides]
MEFHDDQETCRLQIIEHHTVTRMGKLVHAACRVHKYVELNEVVAENMLELDPADPWIGVMLSNFHAHEAQERTKGDSINVIEY